MKKKYEEPEMIIDRFCENDGILTSSTCPFVDCNGVACNPDPGCGSYTDLGHWFGPDPFDCDSYVCESLDYLEDSD